VTKTDLLEGFMKFNSKVSLSVLCALFLALSQTSCGKSHKQQGQEIGEKLDKAEEKAKEMSREAKERAHKAAENAKEKGRETKEAAKEKAHDIIDKT
jgi:F0F1-type ATP synthase membrane subunit b/b'